MKLDEKRILITGGGSGIGLELARRLAGRSQVVIAGRDDAKLAEAHRETPALRTVRLDVTSEEEARAGLGRVSEELGGLDLLVNNAGLLTPFSLFDPGAEAMSRAELEVNVGGAIRMTRLAAPLLDASPDAAVMFMSSAVAFTAVPGLAVYAATKAALHSLARSLRAELKLKGIRVFEVLPPVVDTPPVAALDVPKMPPAAVVDAILKGVARDRDEIRVGRVRQLAVLARLAPPIADRVVQRALTPSA